MNISATPYIFLGAASLACKCTRVSLTSIRSSSLLWAAAEAGKAQRVLENVEALPSDAQAHGCARLPTCGGALGVANARVYYTFKRGSVPPRCTLGSAVFAEFFLRNSST